MRYLTHYEEYPIYEAAEGGYYYAGNQVVESERGGGIMGEDGQGGWKGCGSCRGGRRNNKKC